MGSERNDQGPDEDERELFGYGVQRQRIRQDWTAEEAARLAGVAMKTWLRLEHGKEVRSATYAKADEVFGLPTGTLLRAWRDGENLTELFERASSYVTFDVNSAESINQVIPTLTDGQLETLQHAIFAEGDERHERYYQREETIARDEYASAVEQRDSAVKTLQQYRDTGGDDSGVLDLLQQHVEWLEADVKQKQHDLAQLLKAREEFANARRNTLPGRNVNLAEH